MPPDASLTLPAEQTATSVRHFATSEYDLRRFASWHLLGLLIFGLLLTLLSRDGRIDFFLEELFFDRASGVFPLRELPLLAVYGHAWLKNVTTLIWLLCMPLALASLRITALRPWRDTLFKFVLYAGLAAMVVQWTKGASAHACPWDLVQFGGSAEWFPLFGSGNASHPGQCWPGGHASGGFAFIAAFFAARLDHRRVARMGLWMGIGLGSMMGVFQMVRGAHFLSHNAWSLWIVWAVCFIVDLGWQLVVRWRQKTVIHF